MTIDHFIGRYIKVTLFFYIVREERKYEEDQIILHSLPKTLPKMFYYVVLLYNCLQWIEFRL